MKKVIYGLMSFAPVLAFAQGTGASEADLSFLEGLVEDVGNALALVVPIMVGLAIIYFFWGLVQYIRSAGDPKAAATGKSIMIYGIIAIFVMVSVWGIVGWLQGVIGIDPDATGVEVIVPGLGGNNP